MYNDFHMEDYDSDLTITGDLLCIDYCRQGRMEYPAGPDAYSYVEAGDLKLDRRLEHRGTLFSPLPLSRDHGGAGAASGSPGPGRMGAGLPGGPGAASRTNTAPAPTLRYPRGLRWIISSRSSTPYRNRSNSPISASRPWNCSSIWMPWNCPRSRRSPTSTRRGGESERPIHRLLTGDLERHYTITELSRRFSIPTTALKECFKSVYGQPINTYMRSLRMDRAALLLRQEPQTSVAEIAGRVGYDSASKFAAAFKAVKGKTPWNTGGKDNKCFLSKRDRIGGAERKRAFLSVTMAAVSESKSQSFLLRGVLPMKERTWLSILLSYAGPCRGKMAASVALAVLSVAGGFVPYLGVYQIIRLFLERQASWEGILFWCGVCLAGYAVKVAGYALSTMLAHVSAYTILEGLRLQVADRLMGAPLGEVESRPIGAMKSTVVDRIEDVEPPLAHMIPELSSNLLLPLAVVIAMFTIDWRMGLALLVTIPVALVPMAAGMRSYNKNYAAYMAANNHVNSVIVEYVEGIQVVKAFSQGERSYAKFAQAVGSFRDFTLNWFRCTWASMNLCLSILPTTLLGTLPVGVYLYQTGVLDPAQVTLCLMMALGIVSPLMSATAFINSMKSMQFAVKDTGNCWTRPSLSQARQEAKLGRQRHPASECVLFLWRDGDTEVLQ